MNTEETGWKYVDWMVQDRDQRRYIVNTIMNHPVQ